MWFYKLHPFYKPITNSVLHNLCKKTEPSHYFFYPNKRILWVSVKSIKDWIYVRLCCARVPLTPKPSPQFCSLVREKGRVCHYRKSRYNFLAAAKIFRRVLEPLPCQQKHVFSHLLKEGKKDLGLGTEENMIAIANEPQTKFGASKGFKPMPSTFARQCTHILGSG